MKLLLFLSLVGVIYCQLLEPTEDQYHCIIDASTDQAQAIFDDCGSEVTDMIGSICNNAACFNRILGIYESCGYHGLNSICDGSVLPTSDSSVTPPNSDQIRCITNAATENQEEYFDVCGDAQQFTDISAICNSGACFDFISTIYSGCGYYGLDAVCGSRVSPPTTNTGLEGLPSPSPDQTQCFTDASTSQAHNDCENVQMDNLDSICNSGTCFTRISSIYEGCGYYALGLACSAGGGNVIGGGTDIPNIPTPSPDQVQCITQQYSNRALDFARECSNINTGDLGAVCKNEGCFNLLSDINKGCGYTHFTSICQHGGSVRVYAVPVFVFLAALLSILSF